MEFLAWTGNGIADPGAPERGRPEAMSLRPAFVPQITLGPGLWVHGLHQHRRCASDDIGSSVVNDSDVVGT